MAGRSAALHSAAVYCWINDWEGRAVWKSGIPCVRFAVRTVHDESCGVHEECVVGHIQMCNELILVFSVAPETYVSPRCQPAVVHHPRLKPEKRLEEHCISRKTPDFIHTSTLRMHSMHMFVCEHV